MENFLDWRYLELFLKFTINTCLGFNDEGEDICSDNIINKIETYLEQPIELSGHISTNHDINNHTIWLFLYDNAGKHESLDSGVVVIQDTDITTKWTGKTPILSELEELFVGE